MRKNQNILHSDYTPKRVINRTISSTIGGAIIKLRFKKTKHLTILNIIWFPSRYKDLYFWLPYKRIMDASPKYGVLGSSKRFPYANVWFEVKLDSEIYEQGLRDFIFRRRKLYKAEGKIRLALPFLTDELLTLTCKKVIRKLDGYVFASRHNRKP
jgi:hypothetical protein